MVSVFRGKMRKTVYMSYFAEERFRFMELSIVVNGANPQAKIAHIIKAASEA